MSIGDWKREEEGRKKMKRERVLPLLLFDWEKKGRRKREKIKKILSPLSASHLERRTPQLFLEIFEGKIFFSSSANSAPPQYTAGGRASLSPAKNHPSLSPSCHVSLIHWPSPLSSPFFPSLTLVDTYKRQIIR